MECALCGNKVKALNQDIIHHLVKKYVDLIGDYAFVNIKRDRERGSVCIKVTESDSERYTKPVNMNDSLWTADCDEVDLVMLKYDNSMNFIEKGEMDELIEKYKRQEQ